MTGAIFSGKLALQQRVLAAYRAPFFESLAQACAGGLSICAGQPRPDEAILVTEKIHNTNCTTLVNHHIFGGTFYFCYQRGLLRWLNSCSPDALILEANPRYLANLAAIRWMKNRGRPVLGWGLGAQIASNPSHFGLRVMERMKVFLRLFFLRSFDALITYSRNGADEYSALGIPTNKIFIAANAVTPPPTLPMPERPTRISGKPNVLFVGRLQARKRVDLLLKACASLPETLQPHLVIVGDGPERKSLEDMAKSIYPLAEFPGEKRNVELTSYFYEADLFVLPGTGGLAVQEAMSYGLPVVMGQGDGTNDELVRPGNGWQIPPDDLSALVGILQTALSDVPRLRSMGYESFRIVSEEINLQKMVEVFIEALNSVSRLK